MSIITGEGISTALVHYAKFLQATYAVSPVAKRDKLPVTPTTKYVTLALVKKAEKLADVKALTMLSLYGNIDQILDKREMIKIGDIVREAGIRLVVVEGAPGAGKSMLAWELCRQWPTLPSMERFSLVVLLRLREEGVRSAREITDLLYHRNAELSKRVGQIVEEKEGEGVLFVFDGFDELPSELRESSFVMDIINGSKYLPKATVVVTSRPSALDELEQPLMQASKHVEILGFSREEVLKFASEIFKNDMHTFLNFRKYLAANPVVMGMLSNPLNCAIVVGVYKETSSSDQPVPETKTQLYTELTLCLLSKYLSEKGDNRAKKLPDRLEDLSHHSDLYEQLLALGRLAFEGIAKNDVIFKELPQGCSDLGLLVEHNSLYLRTEITTFNFIHVTLQEYMAAFYVSQLKPITMQQELLMKHLKVMHGVWRFVAGLTKMSKVGWDIFKKVESVYKWRFEFEEYEDYESEDDEVWGGPFLFLCLYEAQDAVSLKTVFGGERVTFATEVLSGVLDFDMYAYGYCVAASENYFLCDFSCTCNLPSASIMGFEMFGHGTKSVHNCRGKIKELNMSHCPGILSKKSMDACLPLPLIQHMQCLFLRDCDMKRESFENLTKSIAFLPSLELLDISDNVGATGAVGELLTSLCGHEKLQTLNMTDIPLDFDDIVALSKLLQFSSSLKELHVGSMTGGTDRLSLSLYEQLETIVLQSSSLEKVGIITQRESVKSISDSVISLAIVTPDHQQPVAGAGHRWSRLISENTFLENLKLHVAFVRDELQAIVSCLEVNHSLKTLELSKKLHSLHFTHSMCVALKPRVVFS